jgi:hypothetical protein
MRDRQMAGEPDSRDHIFEDESLRLKDALKSCRNVVANYRAMLAGEGSNDNSASGNTENESRIG